MALLPCPTCGQLEFDECTDIIIEDAGLTPDTAYWAIIKDQFENYYKQQFTTDENGTLVIEATSFPEGLFVKAMGAFTVFVSTSQKIRDAVAITLQEGYADPEEFICLEVNFLPVGGGGVGE